MQTLDYPLAAKMTVLSKGSKYFNFVRSFTLAMIVCGISASTATALSRSEYEQQVHLAYKYAFAEHYEKAQHILVPLKDSPYTDSTMLVTLADCYRQEWGSHPAQLAEADAACKRALVLDPQCGKAYTIMGEMASLKGHHEQAVKLFDRALKCKPLIIAALYNRGKANAALKRYDEALKDLDEWDKLHSVMFKNDRDSPQGTAFIRAQVLQAMGRYEQAVDAYKKSYPRYRSEFTDRAIIDCLTKAGKFDEAIGELSKRLSKDSQDDLTFFQRGQLKAQVRDYRGAVADFTRAIELGGTTSYYVERAKAYDALKDVESARKDREKAKSLSQKSL